MRSSLALAVALASHAAMASDIGTAGSSFGGGPVASPVLLPDGSLAAPSWAWSSDVDGSGTGCYRSAANEIACGLNGVLALKLTSASGQVHRGSSGGAGAFSLFTGASAEYARFGLTTSYFAATMVGLVGGVSKGAIAVLSADGVVSGPTVDQPGKNAAVVFADGINTSTGAYNNLAYITGAGGRVMAVKSTVACSLGVATWTPSTTGEVVALTSGGAACTVTVSETDAVPGQIATIIVADSTGAGSVVFPDAVNILDAPTLCASTGLTQNGSMTITYVDKTNDMFVAVSCVQP